MKNKRKLILLGILLVAVSAYIAYRLMNRAPFTYAGTLETTNVDLSSQVASIIDQVTVHEGDRVKEDELLVQLDCGDIRIAARLANENYERANKLFHGGTITQEAYDQSANRKQDSDLRLRWCEIHSPIQGTILARYHEPGEWVNPGTKILTLANIQDIWAYIYVPQPLIAKLSLGMRLIGRLPELPKQAFPGKITWINDEAEFTPKNVQTEEERTRLIFAVKVAFENPKEILKPGMTIEVNLPEQVRQ